MTTIVLKPGDTIRIELHETDGAFEITYGEKAVTVWSEFPGSIKGDAGEIYREEWKTESKEIISCLKSGQYGIEMDK